MGDSKYKMFRNFMINELQISKEDIQEWVKESVTQEVKKLVNQEYQKFSIEKVIETVILDNESYFTGRKLRSDISDKISKIICDKITINVTE
jgi:serine protease inhibitor